MSSHLRIDVAGATNPWRQIVGVVGNVKSYSESTRDEPEVYEPYLQRPVSSFSIILRTDLEPGALASALRSAVSGLDPDLPVAHVMTMPTLLDRQNGGDKFFGRILGSFAVLALVLSAIGIYGLIGYSVSQRTHEIGIRMALGAEKSSVLRLVLTQGLQMAVIGGSIGFVMALPLPKLFAAIFYDLQIHEPILYLMIPAAILAVAMFATYVPARRAARVDPMVALRHE